MAYFVWLAVFGASGSERLGGFTFRGMVLYYVLAVLLGKIVRGQERDISMSQDIYEGSLTKYLLYPCTYFWFKYAEHLGSLAPALVQLVLLGSVSALLLEPGGEFTITPMTVGMTVVAVAAANLMSFLIVYPAQGVAFWADNVWTLNVMVRFTSELLGGLMLPLSLFPQWAQGLPGLDAVSVPLLLPRDDADRSGEPDRVGAGCCRLSDVVRPDRNHRAGRLEAWLSHLHRSRDLMVLARYGRLYLHFLRFSFSRAMEFRLDFWFRIVMDVIYYAVHLAFFTIIYQHTSLLGGWTLDQTYIFVCGFLLVDALDMTIFATISGGCRSSSTRGISITISFGRSPRCSFSACVTSPRTPSSTSSSPPDSSGGPSGGIRGSWGQRGS